MTTVLTVALTAKKVQDSANRRLYRYLSSSPLLLHRQVLLPWLHPASSSAPNAAIEPRQARSSAQAAAIRSRQQHPLLLQTLARQSRLQRLRLPHLISAKLPVIPAAPAAPAAPVAPVAPVTPTSDIGKTVALQPVVEIKSSTSDIGKTVALRMPEPEKKPAKTKPAAFMVCIAGDNAGDSFTVAEGRNYIASGKDADIKLDKDSTVSAECHAVVTYNPSENKFTLSAGTGRGITYLNGGQVDVSAELKADDRIKVGKSELLFIPVCSDKFKWDDKA